jgi:hypothetical protein
LKGTSRCSMLVSSKVPNSSRGLGGYLKSFLDHDQHQHYHHHHINARSIPSTCYTGQASSHVAPFLAQPGQLGHFELSIHEPSQVSTNILACTCFLDLDLGSDTDSDSDASTIHPRQFPPSFAGKNSIRRHAESPGCSVIVVQHG